ncbi:MAG TPA: GNAT family N-acetyltransferase, partial [Flavobacteriales bacterium]|nr:GNAT family N-acetyltransferase [Flavobacteriales bacterium]
GIRDSRTILHLFVADAWQRRGIAQAHWERAKSDLLAAADEVELVVRSSIYAIPVYERFGFKVSGPRVEGAGVTYVPMQLTIRRDEQNAPAR